MDVTFHAVTSFGISHVAARSLAPDSTETFERDDVRVLITAFVAGVLSHGILDGLKHGYPIHYALELGRRFRVALLPRGRAGSTRPRRSRRRRQPDRLRDQPRDRGVPVDRRDCVESKSLPAPPAALSNAPAVGSR
jgi:hypothetical protein